MPPADYRVAEVRLLHDLDEVGETSGQRSRAKDNLLIVGDVLNTVTSLWELPSSPAHVGKVKLAYLDPPFNTQQAFEQYDDAWRYLLLSEDDIEAARGSWGALRGVVSPA